MQDYFDLITVPGTKKKLRVYWEDGESQGPSDHRPWHMEKYTMNGIGEDGSVWEQYGDYDENTDDFYEEGEAEMIDKAGSVSVIKYEDELSKWPGYWDNYGKNPLSSMVWADRFKDVPIKEYFKIRVGDYPNVNIKKGPSKIAYEEQLKNDPAKFHQAIVGAINWGDMEKINVDKNKHSSKKYIYKWDEEKQADIIVATDYGIVHDILTSSHVKVSNMIQRFQKTKKGNEKNNIINAIKEYLL